MKVTVAGQVEGMTLVVLPGDTLVVRVRPDIAPDLYKEFSDLLAARAPDGVKILLIAAEELAVIRGTQAAEAVGG